MLCLAVVVTIATHSNSCNKQDYAVVTNRSKILKCGVRVFLSPSTSPLEVIWYPSCYSLGYQGLCLSHTSYHLTDRKISMGICTGNCVCLSLLFITRYVKPVTQLQLNTKGSGDGILLGT